MSEIGKDLERVGNAIGGAIDGVYKAAKMADYSSAVELIYLVLGATVLVAGAVFVARIFSEHSRANAALDARIEWWQNRPPDVDDDEPSSSTQAKR